MQHRKSTVANGYTPKGFTLLDSISVSGEQAMGAAATVSVDEFQALEQKVLQAVELIKKEREARHTAESERDAARAEAEELRSKLQTETDSASNAHGEVEALHREREAVRQRVERMLGQIDELLLPAN